MNRSVAKQCESCGREFRAPVETGGELACPHCCQRWDLSGFAVLAHACPFCDARHFYRQKDFNPVLGLGIVVLGAALVPFTYGLSLPVLALLDWWLYRRVGEVAICYKCRAEFRGFALSGGVGPYSHHTAFYYEKYENAS